MKVHLIKEQSINDYVQKNARSRPSFATWLSLLKRADWSMPGDIVKTYNSADILGKGSDRVVFNIGGNSDRLICHYFFGEKRVHLFIKWIGSHAQYSKLCKDSHQFTINRY